MLISSAWPNLSVGGKNYLSPHYNTYSLYQSQFIFILMSHRNTLPTTPTPNLTQLVFASLPWSCLFMLHCHLLGQIQINSAFHAYILVFFQVIFCLGLFFVLDYFYEAILRPVWASNWKLSKIANHVCLWSTFLTWNVT